MTSVLELPDTELSSEELYDEAVPCETTTIVDSGHEYNCRRVAEWDALITCRNNHECARKWCTRCKNKQEFFGVMECRLCPVRYSYITVLALYPRSNRAT
jgi:hypothetical protein